MGQAADHGLLCCENDAKTAREKLQKQAKDADENVDLCYAEQLTVLSKCLQQLRKEIQEELLQKEYALDKYLEHLKSLQNEFDGIKRSYESQRKKASNWKFLSSIKKDLEHGTQKVSNQYKALKMLTDSLEFVPVSHPNLLLGHLFAYAHPCTSGVIDLPHSIVHNTKVDFTIQARNFKGENCLKGGHQVLVKLKSAAGNSTIKKGQG